MSVTIRHYNGNNYTYEGELKSWISTYSDGNGKGAYFSVAWNYDTIEPGKTKIKFDIWKRGRSQSPTWLAFKLILKITDQNGNEVKFYDSKGTEYSTLYDSQGWSDISSGTDSDGMKMTSFFETRYSKDNYFIIQHSNNGIGKFVVRFEVALYDSSSLHANTGATTLNLNYPYTPWEISSFETTPGAGGFVIPTGVIGINWSLTPGANVPFKSVTCKLIRDDDGQEIEAATKVYYDASITQHTFALSQYTTDGTLVRGDQVHAVIFLSVGDDAIEGVDWTEYGDGLDMGEMNITINSRPSAPVVECSVYENVGAIKAVENNNYYLSRDSGGNRININAISTDNDAQPLSYVFNTQNGAAFTPIEYFNTILIEEHLDCYVYAYDGLEFSDPTLLSFEIQQQFKLKENTLVVTEQEYTAQSKNLASYTDSVEKIPYVVLPQINAEIQIGDTTTTRIVIQDNVSERQSGYEENYKVSFILRYYDSFNKAGPFTLEKNSLDLDDENVWKTHTFQSGGPSDVRWELYQYYEQFVDSWEKAPVLYQIGFMVTGTTTETAIIWYDKIYQIAKLPSRWEKDHSDIQQSHRGYFNKNGTERVSYNGDENYYANLFANSVWVSYDYDSGLSTLCQYNTSTGTVASKTITPLILEGSTVMSFPITIQSVPRGSYFGLFYRLSDISSLIFMDMIASPRFQRTAVMANNQSYSHNIKVFPYYDSSGQLITPGDFLLEFILTSDTYKYGFTSLEEKYEVSVEFYQGIVVRKIHGEAVRLENKGFYGVYRFKSNENDKFTYADFYDIHPGFSHKTSYTINMRLAFKNLFGEIQTIRYSQIYDYSSVPRLGDGANINDLKVFFQKTDDIVSEDDTDLGYALGQPYLEERLYLKWKGSFYCTGPSATVKLQIYRASNEEETIDENTVWEDYETLSVQTSLTNAQFYTLKYNDLMSNYYEFDITCPTIGQIARDDYFVYFRIVATSQGGSWTSEPITYTTSDYPTITKNYVKVKRHVQTTTTLKSGEYQTNNKILLFDYSEPIQGVEDDEDQNIRAAVFIKIRSPEGKERLIEWLSEGDETLTNFVEENIRKSYLFSPDDGLTYFENDQGNLTKEDISFVYVSLQVVTKSAITGVQKIGYTNEILVYDLAPTVSYRPNHLGINYQYPDNTPYKDAVLVVNRYGNRQKVYLIGQNENTLTERAIQIDLSRGTLNNFQIYGGSWDDDGAFEEAIYLSAEEILF